MTNHFLSAQGRGYRHPMKRLPAVGLSALGGCAFGAAIGVLVLKSRPRSGMGWDQIADGLGALALGGMVGLVVFLLLALRLDGARALTLGAVTVIVGPLLLVVAARIPGRPAPTAPEVLPFEPTFVFQMYSRIPAGDPGPPAGVDGFPFRELRVDARSWRLTSKGWGPATERTYCAAELDEASLARLAVAVRRVFDEAEESLQNCPGAGRATFSVTVEWQAETRGVASFGLTCMDRGTAMAALLDEFAAVHDLTCE